MAQREDAGQEEENEKRWKKRGRQEKERKEKRVRGKKERSGGE